MAHKWEDTRYNRQIAVPRFGERGQKILGQSGVVVIGAGGVKSSLLLHLAAAGVGRIKIVDFDRVETSNLNRQVIYRSGDVGLHKAGVAATRLRELNPEISVEATLERANPENLSQLTEDFDLILEGGDSAENRLEFNKWAISKSRSYIHASAQYNYSYVVTVIPGESACFECLFSDLPESHKGPVPVMGVATAIAGSMAASEAINMLMGSPQLVGTLLFFDGWSMECNRLPLERKNDCHACQDTKNYKTSMLLQ